MSEQGKSAEGKRRGIIIAVFVILIAALAVCIVLLLKREPVEESQNETLERGFVDEENTDEIMDNMAEKVAEGMFECRMSTSWVFEDGESESPNAYVANVESNLHTLYFDVYDSTTNEKLYSSPMLPVGTEMKGLTLEKVLPKGEYDAVVMYTLVDEDYEEVSTVGFHITITVNN